MIALAIFLILPTISLAVDENIFVHNAGILFNVTDDDSDGDISLKELETIFFDPDGDGSISQAEFVQWYNEIYGTTENAVVFMSLIDRNKDGMLTDDPDLDSFFFMINPNSDGFSTWNEFIPVVSSLFRTANLIAGR